jgi:hypothetical protein
VIAAVVVMEEGEAVVWDDGDVRMVESWVFN